jgi:hypothetical protein
MPQRRGVQLRTKEYPNVKEKDLRLQEMTQVRNIMRTTAEKTKEKFDTRMRSTVKGLLIYRYAPKTEPADVERERRYHEAHFEIADIFSDIFFKVNNSERRQFMKEITEWARGKPLRVFLYIQKLADIFPAQYLTLLLRTSLKNTAEQTIAIYEANKGDALRSDYSGEPSGIDSAALPITVTVKAVRKKE